MLMRFDAERLDEFRTHLDQLADAGVEKVVVNLPTPHRIDDVDHIVRMVAEVG